METIRYRIDLLEALHKPLTCYEVEKMFKLPHSTAHKILTDYTKQGIVIWSQGEKTRVGLYKKHYQLSNIGQDLLRLVTDIESYKDFS